MMKIINDFIARYRRELDFYDRAARLVAQRIELIMQSSGIHAMVTSRAKDPEWLRDKVEERAKDGRYATVDDIYEDIVDLAGVRISLLGPPHPNSPASRISLATLFLAHLTPSVRSSKWILGAP